MSPTRQLRRILSGTVLPLWLLVSNGSLAMAPDDITAAEIALIPNYCTQTLTFPQATHSGRERWTAIYGPMFTHFHHYCWALIWIMRSERYGVTEVERRGHLLNADGDLKYVIKYLPSDHPLLPEMNTVHGKVLCRVGKSGDGVEVLTATIRSSSAYWRAYNELAKCYERQNDTRRAIEVLREGLKQAPSARVLRIYLDDLTADARTPRKQ